MGGVRYRAKDRFICDDQRQREEDAQSGTAGEVPANVGKGGGFRSVTHTTPTEEIGAWFLMVPTGDSLSGWTVCSASRKAIPC